LPLEEQVVVLEETPLLEGTLRGHCRIHRQRMQLGKREVTHDVAHLVPVLVAQHRQNLSEVTLAERTLVIEELDDGDRCIKRSERGSSVDLDLDRLGRSSRRRSYGLTTKGLLIERRREGDVVGLVEKSVRAESDENPCQEQDGADDMSAPDPQRENRVCRVMARRFWIRLRGRVGHCG
jgi:hypothetical protein